jgi:Flp pilus assembly protein TadD
VDVYYVLGTLALNMGRVEEAVAHLERYLEMAPEDAPYRSTASELVTQLGQAEQSQPQ